MNVLYEWNFHNRICRVVESEPGIVHFEEASRTTGDPSIMLFNYTPTPMGAANEIIQLSMALAEANVINRELSSAIQRWQEERNFCEQEISALRARVKELSALVRYATFHHGHYGYESPTTRDESFYFTPAGVGNGGVESRLPDEFQEAARIAHGVPPIQLPEDEG